MTYEIPFNKPYVAGGEFEYIGQALKQNHLAGDGPFTQRAARILEESLGCEKALLTTSCTHALEMAALLFDIRPGDEVIVPSFTFVSTVNAFVLRGAKPRFADIRLDTLNIDETLVESLLSSRTRAIAVVHYAGVVCEMDAIEALSKSHEIPIVEDAAHALFSKYKGRLAGRLSSLATLSFHETKNFTCGEGGALLINDAGLVERAEIIREKGTNRSRFFRGQVDKYSWVDVGSSYLPSEILAAYLAAQLEARDSIQLQRKMIWNRYHSELAAWAAASGVSQPNIPSHCEQSFHMYYLLMPTPAARDALIATLREKSILAVFHYLPLHLSEMGRRFGGRVGECPVTESVSDRLVRLPFFNSMTADEQSRVIEAVLQFDP